MSQNQGRRGTVQSMHIADMLTGMKLVANVASVLDPCYLCRESQQAQKRDRRWPVMGSFAGYTDASEAERERQRHPAHVSDEVGELRDGRPSSGTLTSSGSSKSPAPEKIEQSSASFAGLSALLRAGLSAGSVPGNEEDSEDHEDVFCICRKPEHGMMIACDGGCEDWFHAPCVGLRPEHRALIDKYICTRLTSVLIPVPPS